MKAFAAEVLDLLELAAVGYGDVRVVTRRSEHMTVKNGALEGWSDEQSEGFGIRVLLDGAWGFAASLSLERPAAEHAVRLAVQRAQAAASVGGSRVRLAPVDPVEDVVRLVPLEDPFRVSAEDKLSLLLSASDALSGADIALREASFGAVREDKVFASTEGSLIEQSRSQAGAGVEATAIRDGDVQTRSYPAGHGGLWQLGGFEVVRALDLSGHAPAVAEEAAQLLDAPPCPSTVTTVVLDADQVALQVHESIGHPTELDRVLGTEASYAGTSFLRAEDAGRLRYGSPLVNVTADATTPLGLGRIPYDDEGVPGHRVDLIRDGVLVGFQTSRETAAETGQNRSSGGMRASSWNRLPLVRMTNINLLPGEGSLEELIEGVEDGVFMATNKSWSIDDRRLNFHFGTEIGRRIERGRLTTLLRDCTYSGVTPRFWGSCDAIAGPEAVVVVGLTNCGKGQPGQAMSVSHAVAPARFRQVRVGPA